MRASCRTRSCACRHFPHPVGRIGQPDRGFVEAAPIGELDGPCAECVERMLGVVFSNGRGERGPGALNEQGTDVDIAAHP